MSRALHSLVLLALMVILSGPGGALAAPEAAGRVAVLQGTATASSASGEARTLSARAPIFANDTIETGEDSRLQLFFLDESILTLGPVSRVTIDRYVFDPATADGTFAAGLAGGTFRMVTGKISRTLPNRMKIITPVATIGIRGCYLAGRLDERQGSLSLLFLGGLRGAERGIFAVNEQGSTDLDLAGYGLEVVGPATAPSPPIKFSLDQIQNLLSGTELTAAAAPRAGDGGAAVTGRSGGWSGDLGGGSGGDIGGSPSLGGTGPADGDDPLGFTLPPAVTLPDAPTPVQAPASLPDPPPPPD